MGMFGKKKSGDDDDSGRSALFSRSKKSSPAPSASNPYAQPPPAADPYADTNKYGGMGPTPYQQAKSDVGPPGGSRAGGLPSGPGAGAPGGGYGADRYGSGGGYGANRYDGAGAPPPARGPSGYGGLGRTNSVDTMATEDNRNALFGDAKDRYVQNAAAPGDSAQPGAGYGAPSGGGGYGAYGEERQLTAEEEEEEDVQATKQQIRFMKQEDVSSTRNALRIAAQAEETGRATLARLGAQGERIHNTEKNLDLAANHNRIAEEKAKELKTLNKSMFAVHVSNPFTASSRRAQRDQDIIDKHREEREQRDETRRAAYGTKSRMEGAFKELQAGDAGYKPKQRNLAERSKYQFEADSEDDAMENEIEENLDLLSGAAGRLNLLARATGQEVDAQNAHLDTVARKVIFIFARKSSLQSITEHMLTVAIDGEGRRSNRHEQSEVGTYSLIETCGHSFIWSFGYWAFRG
jgi:hypothetical protein